MQGWGMNYIFNFLGHCGTCGSRGVGVVGFPIKNGGETKCGSGRVGRYGELDKGSEKISKVRLKVNTDRTDRYDSGLYGAFRSILT